MATYHATPGPPYYSWTPGQVELWDISTGSPVGAPGPGHMLSSAETMTLGLAFSPDGSRLVTGSGLHPDNNGDCTQGEVVLWDVAEFPKRIWDPERVPPLGDPRPTDSPSAAVSELTFAPGRDGRLIAAGTVGGSVLLINADSGQMVKELPGGHRGPVMSLAFFHDKGKETLTLASGSNDTDVRLWDVNVTEPTKAREICQPMTAHVGGVRALVFERTGAGLLSAGSDDAVIRWNVTTSSPLSRALGRTDGRPRAVAYSPDGIVATAGTGTGPGGVVVQFWEGSVAPMTSNRPDGRERLEILQPLTGLEGRGAPVLGLAFSPDGRLLVAGDLAGNVLFWDMARARDPDPKADRRPIPVAESGSPRGPDQQRGVPPDAPDRGLVRRRRAGRPLGRQRSCPDSPQADTLAQRICGHRRVRSGRQPPRDGRLGPDDPPLGPLEPGQSGRTLEAAGPRRRGPCARLQPRRQVPRFGRDGCRRVPLGRRTAQARAAAEAAPAAGLGRQVQPRVPTAAIQ